MTVAHEENDDQRVLELGGERAPGRLASERLSAHSGRGPAVAAPPRRSTARATRWRGERSRPQRIRCARSASHPRQSAVRAAAGAVQTAAAASCAPRGRRHGEAPVNRLGDFPPEVASQPCPFTVNAAALGRCPSPAPSISRMVTAIPTTSTKNGQALIALLPGVASHERQREPRTASDPPASKRKGETLAPWAVGRSCEGLACSWRTDRTVRVPRSLDDSAARADPA